MALPEIHDGLWASQCCVTAEGTEATDQADLGSSNFCLDDRVISDKYVISQSHSLLFYKMERIFTLQIVVNFSNIMRRWFSTRPGTQEVI